MTVPIGAIARLQLDAQDRDPLARLRPSAPQKKFIRSVASGVRTYWRSSNWGGKSFIGACIGVAVSRGLTSVAGITLPRLNSPTIGNVLIRDYGQAATSINVAYLKAIGTHDHEIGWIDKRAGTFGTIWVRPDAVKSSKFEDWSRIDFVSQKNQDSNLGGRLDWVQADEPPVQFTWSEATKAGLASRGFLAFITATPIHAEEWDWLEAEFSDCIDIPRRNQVMLTSSIWDAVPEVLSQQEAEELVASWEKDPWRLARIYGTPVDISGTNPFSGYGETLDEMRAATEDPKRERVLIRSKTDPRDGSVRREITVDVEFFGELEPNRDEAYYISCDLAEGIRSDMHDPLCLHLVARSARRLVVRYNDYLHPYGLGWLAATLAIRYNTPLARTLIDFERDKGLSDQFLEGVDDCFRERSAGMANVNRENYRSQQSGLAKREGYSQGEQSRDNIIQAIIRGLADRDFVCKSRAVLDCLAQCVYDGRGRIVARKGYHDDDLICLGRWLHICKPGSVRQRPKEAQSDTMSNLQAILDRQFGRHVDLRGARHEEGMDLLWEPPAA